MSWSHPGAKASAPRGARGTPELGYGDVLLALLERLAGWRFTGRSLHASLHVDELGLLAGILLADAQGASHLGPLRVLSVQLHQCRGGLQPERGSPRACRLARRAPENRPLRRKFTLFASTLGTRKRLFLAQIALCVSFWSISGARADVDRRHQKVPEITL